MNVFAVMNSGSGETLLSTPYTKEIISNFEVRIVQAKCKLVRVQDTSYWV